MSLTALRYFSALAAVLKHADERQAGDFIRLFIENAIDGTVVGLLSVAISKK